MEGIKFLDDNEVSELFSESDNSAENTNNVLTISSEEAAKMFSGDNGSDFDVDTNSNGNNESNDRDDKKTSVPIKNVDYTSITKQFVDEGIFPEMSDDEINGVNLDSFKRLISDAINNGVDEQTKRVNEALELGLDRNEVVEFEQTIKFLHGIQSDDIHGESEESDVLRHRLILQDLLNNGVEQDEAVQKVKEIFKQGNDIVEAEKALKANKEFFQQAYKNAIEEKRKESESWKNNIDEQTKELKTSIMDSNEKYLGEITLNDDIKKLAFKNLSEPKYKDKKTGEMLTAIQRYERNNKTDFLKNLGILFTLTDGFKNLDKLIGSSVTRRVNKEIKNVESVLRNPSSSDHNLKMVTSGNSQNNKFSFDV